MGGWGVGRQGAERAHLGGRRRSSRERVPTSVQRRPQAPSEPSGAGGPARGAARRALLALQKAARKTKAIPAGRRALRGSRSASAVGRGGVGWVRSARPQSGPRAAAGSEARQMPAASCTSHAPSPPPLFSRCRSPPSSSSTQSRAGERDPPPARPAARRGLPAPGALTPSRSAPTCRRPWPAVLRGRRDERGRRAGGAVGSGPRRRGARLGKPGRSGGAAKHQASYRGAPRPPPRRGRSLCRVPAIRNNVELPGRRVEPRSLLSLSFSHSPSSSLSAALPVMSARGGGVSINPLLAAHARPAPGPGLRPAPPRTPSAPGRGGIPGEGRGGRAQAHWLGRCPSVAFPPGRGPEG